MTDPRTFIRHSPAKAYDRDDHWDTRAACADHDPEMWWSADPLERSAARKICRNECPVRAECLDAAIARFDWTPGIYADMDGDQRRAEYNRRAKRRRAAQK